MAVLPTLGVSISPFRAKSLIGSPFQLRAHALPHTTNRHVSCASSSRIRIVAAQFGIPDEAKMQMKTVKEHLCKSLPESVKNLPWKKMEDQVVQLLLSLGQQTFKWSFLAWFVLSFVSDILFTMSRNQELVMPFGLFVGCFLSNFMKEISEELFQESPVKDLNWKFVGIASVFVVCKFISLFLAIRGRIFLVHVANGGLMQILWLWKKSQEHDVENVENAQK